MKSSEERRAAGKADLVDDEEYYLINKGTEYASSIDREYRKK